MFSPAQCKPTPKSQRVDRTKGVQQWTVAKTPTSWTSDEMKSQQLSVLARELPQRRKLTQHYFKQKLKVKGNHALTAMKARAIWQRSGPATLKGQET